MIRVHMESVRNVPDTFSFVVDNFCHDEALT